MRTKDSKSQLKVPEVTAGGQVLRAEDPFHSWILFFLTTSTQLKNPRLSIYARILSKMRHRMTSEVPCMAVASMAGRYVLLYNESWTRRSTYLEFVATLAHEAMHIILRHFPRSKRRMAAIPPELRRAAHHIMNVAMDVVVNQMLLTHFPHMKHGISGTWLLPEPLGLPVDADMNTQFEILWSHQHALYQRAKEIVEERKKQRQQEQEQKKPGDSNDGEGEGGDEPNDKAVTPGAPGGDQEEGQGEGQGEGQPGGSGQGKKTKSPANGPSEEHFEAQAQAVADLMEAKAHQWQIKLGEDGEPTENVELDDFSGLDADELEASATMLEEEGKHLVASAIKQHQKSRGTVPADLRQALEAILFDAIVPWSTVLKNLVSARLLSSRRPTMDRPHKRRHIMWMYNEETEMIERLTQVLPQYPGSRRNKTYVCLFAVDTSGSMSKPDLIEGLSEMKGLLEKFEDAHLIVVQCDTRISSVDIVGPTMDVEEYVEAVGRTSYGGTTFNDPFQLAQFMGGEAPPPPLPRREETLRKLSKYKHVDVIIYFTDGYAPTPPERVRPSCPTIWLCTKNATTSALTFGHVIERD